MKKILLLIIISYAFIFNVIQDASSELLKVNPIEDNTLIGFGPSSSNPYTEKEIKQMDLILTPQSIRSATKEINPNLLYTLLSYLPLSGIL